MYCSIKVYFHKNPIAENAFMVYIMRSCDQTQIATVALIFNEIAFVKLKKKFTFMDQ